MVLGEPGRVSYSNSSYNSCNMYTALQLSGSESTASFTTLSHNNVDKYGFITTTGTVYFSNVNIIGNIHQLTDKYRFFELTGSVYLYQCTIADNVFQGNMFYTVYNAPEIVFYECTVTDDANKVFQISLPLSNLH